MAFYFTNDRQKFDPMSLHILVECQLTHFPDLLIFFFFFIQSLLFVILDFFFRHKKYLHEDS